MGHGKSKSQKKKKGTRVRLFRVCHYHSASPERRSPAAADSSVHPTTLPLDTATVDPDDFFFWLEGEPELGDEPELVVVFAEFVLLAVI